jgi:hypothetical protein
MVGEYVIGSSETLLTTYKTAGWQNPEDHNPKVQISCIMNLIYKTGLTLNSFIFFISKYAAWHIIQYGRMCIYQLNLLVHYKIDEIH